MINSGKRKSHPIYILLLIFVLIPPLSGNPDKNEIRELHLEGRFGKIIETYSEPGPDNRDIGFQLIYLESLIRKGELKRSEKFITKMKISDSTVPGLRVLEGMKELAGGNIITAEDIAASIAEEDRGLITFLQLKYYIEMYKRNFVKAEPYLSGLRNHRSGFGESQLFFLISADYYRTVKEFGKLSVLYKERMKILGKKKNREYYDNLKQNYKLYKRKTKNVFRIDSDVDRIEVPFENNGKGALKSIVLKKGEKKFSILLDTGNTSGWLIHSRDLREDLKSVRGGRIVMQVGTESGNLDGFNIFSGSIDFEKFSIKGMFGNYIPKPRPDFFDANLNPAMVRNRVVSLDFIKNRLILRSKERFDSDIVNNKKMVVMKIPWYGYSYPMVPVICNSKNSLAIIETGAENISVRSDFAVEMGIPMIPRSKYLSNGKVFQYSLGAVNVQLGTYIFVRKQAEIWPLLRFRNRMTGLAPHVIIGPEALSGKFIVSFVPEEKILVFEYERKN
ncbi:MAG: hypothetical protein ABFR36_08865 [Acidobacteriota bacterium]